MTQEWRRKNAITGTKASHLSCRRDELAAMWFQQVFYGRRNGLLDFQMNYNLLHYYLKLKALQNEDIVAYNKIA